VTQKGLELPEPPKLPEGPYAGANFEEYMEGQWSGDVTQVAWVAARQVQEIAMLDLSGYESRQTAAEAARGS
jgi:hypothetical protein